MRDLLLGGSYGHEFEGAPALGALGYVHQADLMRRRGISRLEFEDEDRALGPEMSTAGYGFSRAVRYGGSAGGRGASAAYGTAMASEVANMRSRAELARKGGDPMGARALETAADRLQISTVDEMSDAIFGARSEEVGAGSALSRGRASRDFGAALYSGRSARDLPWGARSGAAASAANQLTQLMIERGDRLSPADRLRMTEQIESYRYEATVGIAKEREEAVNRQTVSTHGLAAARYGADRIEQTIRGSALESAMGESDAKIRALQEQKRAIEEILSTSKMLSYEQRQQLQTSLEQVRADQSRAMAAREIAASNARMETVTTEANKVRGSASIGLIEGAGGPRAIRLLSQQRQGTQMELDQAIKERQNLINKGFDANNPDVQRLDNTITGKRIELAQQTRELSVAPESPELSMRRSNLQTATSLAQMGYGTYGDIRGLLKEQVRATADRLKELEAGRAEAKRTGKWTPAMEADYTLAKNQEVLNASQLASQYNEGWDQRLISEAYNMPTGINGHLALTNFTRRESALSGINLPGLGGTGEQMDRYRMMYPNAMRLLSGDRGAFADRTISGADIKHDFGVSVKIEFVGEAARVLRTAGTQISQFGSAKSFSENSDAARRPSG